MAQSIPAYAAITNQAIVTGQTPRGTVITSPTATEVITTALPLLEIAVTQTMTHTDSDGIAGWSAGDIITFKISGQNTGIRDLSTILLASTLSAGAVNHSFDAPISAPSGDNGLPNVMEPNETWVWTAEYTVQQSDIDAGLDFRNIVNISGEFGTITGDGQDISTLPLIQTPSIALSKQAITNEFGAAGSPFDWEVEVTNNGNLTLSNIIVTDVGANSIACSLSGDATVATLAPQAVETCAVQTSLTAQNIADSSTVNVAEVTAIAANGANLSGNATATAINPGINLTTVKTLESGVDPLAFGSVARYLIRVDNVGTRDATNVQLTDSLPTGLIATASNGTASIGTYDEVSGLWAIGDLAIGDSAVLTLEGTITPDATAATIINTIAAATADQTDADATGDVLSVSFTPLLSTIVAQDDTPTNPINALNGEANALNVLSNDLLNDIIAATTSVDVSIIGSLPAGFALSDQGVLSVAQGTTPGDYSFDYQICEVINPFNCAQATVSVTIVNFAPNIVGKLYLDQNNDSALGAEDSTRSGYTVQLVASNGDIVTETTTDNEGNYTLSGVPFGTYDIIYLDADGVGAGIIQGVVASATQTEAIVANLPADPSGVLYNSVTGQPVAGGVARIYNDDSGALLPASCLLPRQQAQTTDADGEYRFDIVTGADAACPIARARYRIEFDQPLRYKPVPSQNIPPQSGALSAVECPGDRVPGPRCGMHVINEAPPISSPSRYYLEFLIGRGDPDIVHNHVPLDPIIAPATSGIFVSKTAAQQNVVRGDQVVYNVAISNSGSFDYQFLSFRDVLPAGLTYIPGSARWNGSPLNVEREGSILRFEGQTLSIGGDAALSYAVRVGANAQIGDKQNEIYAVTQNGQRISTISRARITVRPEPIFDCSEVIGRVFLDVNRNGRQDDGETGVGAARVVTTRGTLITADEFGRFSIPCAELPDAETGTNFILKLDTRSLPIGYFETTENPRVVRLTAGRATQINFGVAAARDVRIDLDENAYTNGTAEPNADLRAGLEQLARVLGEEPSVLRLSYFSNGEAQALIAARLQNVEILLQSIMTNNGSTEVLSIETRIIR